MRIPFTILLLLLVGLCLNSSLQAQSYASHDRPQHYYQLAWNNNLSSWDSLYRVSATYDVNGRLITKETRNRNGNAWLPSLLQEIRYVGLQDSIIKTQSVWNGSSWSPDSRQITTRDPLGRITLEMNQVAGTSLWDTISGTRFQYLDDLNGRLEDILIEDFVDPTSQWDTTLLTHYRYGTGTLPDTIEYAYYSGGFWYPVYRDLDLQWYDFTTFRAKNYRRQLWDGSAYLNDERVDCSFGPYEYKRCTTEQWTINTWLPDVRDKHLKDFASHLTDQGYERHNGTSWDITTWSHYTHVYNGGKLSETIQQNWSNGPQQLENFAKYVYFDFATETKAPAEGQPFVAFPIPARDRLYVRTEVQVPLDVELRDMQGRTCLRLRTSADALNGQGIDVTQLPAGLYLLTLQAGKTMHSLRVSVAH
jgi:hypothetical protein